LVASEVHVSATSDPLATVSCDLLALPYTRAGLSATDAEELAAAGIDTGILASLLRKEYRHGDCSISLTFGKISAQQLATYFVEDDQPFTLREAAQALAQRARGCSVVAARVPRTIATGADPLAVFARGFGLGAYSFDLRQGADPSRPTSKTLRIIDSRPAVAAEPCARAELIISAIEWARDLINRPASQKPPLIAADMVRQFLESSGASVSIWDAERLRDERFAGALGVAAGSVHPACLVEARYPARPVSDWPSLVFVGKGITFDSGGLDLKNLDEMVTMKYDLAGAAAAGAVLGYAARRALAVNLLALLPFAENMPGPLALKPGDVLRHRNGQSTEVISPDAEGRLLISDALSYGAEQHPTAMIDIATLDGGTAVGPDLWGVLGNDIQLVTALTEAGKEIGDPGWALPLWAPYRRHIESDVANLRNRRDNPKEPIGVVTSALFLEHFVDGVPWAHIDIAGTGFRQAPSHAWQTGATGSPIIALAAFVERVADDSDAGAIRSSVLRPAMG
jgi:leucyl aminopeptidase